MSCAGRLPGLRRLDRTATRIVILATALVPVGAADARADERIVAGPGNRYLSETVEIDQGERLTFLNQDVTSHNVRARQDGPDGGPLFGSPIIAGGEEAFVEGSQYLPTGSYAFYCTLHAFMEGRLNVSTAGAPMPRPGSEDGDRQPPVAAVRLRDQRIQPVVRRRALLLRAETDEPARLRLTATARVGGRTLRLGALDMQLQRAGDRSLSLPIRGEARRALRKARRARVDIVGRASDDSGNATELRARRTLRR